MTQVGFYGPAARYTLVRAVTAVSIAGSAVPQANTPRQATGSDLSRPSSDNPAGLPGETDDVILSTTHTLPAGASLTVGSLNARSGTVLWAGAVGVSTLTLRGPGSTTISHPEPPPTT